MARQDSIALTVQEFRTEVARLEERELITPSMEVLLSAWIRELEHYARVFANYPLDQRARAGGKLLQSALDFETTIRALAEKRTTVSIPVFNLLREALEKIVGMKLKLEILVLDSDTTDHFLRSRIGISENSLTLSVYLPPSIDYTGTPLLPRIVHEAAHAHSKVFELFSRTPRTVEASHLGEVLCDVVALLITGPAFLYSTERLQFALGASKWRTLSETHPSFACRASILLTHAETLWKGTPLHENIREILKALASIQCNIEERLSQEQLRQKSIAILPEIRSAETASAIWQGIYVDSRYGPQGSMLLDMNVSWAIERRAT